MDYLAGPRLQLVTICRRQPESVALNVPRHRNHPAWVGVGAAKQQLEHPIVPPLRLGTIACSNQGEHGSPGPLEIPGEEFHAQEPGGASQQHVVVVAVSELMMEGPSHPLLATTDASHAGVCEILNLARHGQVRRGALTGPFG